MSADDEPQQVAVALMEEEQTSKSRRSGRNYCTEDYLIGYGIPILIVFLIILFFVLAIIYIRKYNQNCAPTKGVSCRGKLWFFT
jgi:hypothetical protein